MGIIELFLIAVSLSMDAFTVSVCKGLSMKKAEYKYGFTLAFSFGFFQALMPAIGYYLGVYFENYIKTFDHWIAFLLLLFIGGKMIADALKGTDEEVGNSSRSLKEVFVLSVATSIDALAVGITFAFLNVENIFIAFGLIGVITFALSFIGVVLGNKLGSKFGKYATLAGGLILVAIGSKILLEHLGILIF